MLAIVEDLLDHRVNCFERFLAPFEVVQRQRLLQSTIPERPIDAKEHDWQPYFQQSGG